MTYTSFRFNILFPFVPTDSIYAIFLFHVKRIHVNERIIVNLSSVLILMKRKLEEGEVVVVTGGDSKKKLHGRINNKYRTTGYGESKISRYRSFVDAVCRLKVRSRLTEG